MNENEPQKADWIYLRSGEAFSLWACLHDGELISSRSDLLDRVVNLEFSVAHLLDDDTKSTTFSLNLDEVTSVRSIGHFRWPGTFEGRANNSREEYGQLVKDYLAKWREETVGWTEFESALRTDPLQIGDASFVSRNDVTTLRIGGFLDGEKFDDIYFDVFLRGKNLTASRSDGKDFSIEAFIDLGKKYWDDFGN